MDVPSKSNKAWQDIVTGKKTYQLKFLAAKILLGRLTRSVRRILRLTISTPAWISSMQFSRIM